MGLHFSGFDQGAFQNLFALLQHADQASKAEAARKEEFQLKKQLQQHQMKQDDLAEKVREFSVKKMLAELATGSPAPTITGTGSEVTAEGQPVAGTETAPTQQTGKLPSVDFSGLESIGVPTGTSFTPPSMQDLLAQKVAEDKAKGAQAVQTALDLEKGKRSLGPETFNVPAGTAPEIFGPKGGDFSEPVAKLLGEIYSQKEATKRTGITAEASKMKGEDTLQKVEEMDPATGMVKVSYLPKSEVRGKSYVKPPSGQVMNRLQSAIAVNQTGNDIIKELQDPKVAATLGPAMGRYSNLLDFIGKPPPEFTGLAGKIESYALANMGVHGMRSSQGAEQIKGLLTGKHTPESLIAAVKGLQGFSDHFMANNGLQLAQTEEGAPTSLGDLTKALKISSSGAGAKPAKDPLGLFQ